MKGATILLAALVLTQTACGDPWKKWAAAGASGGTQPPPGSPCPPGESLWVCTVRLDCGCLHGDNFFNAKSDPTCAPDAMTAVDRVQAGLATDPAYLAKVVFIGGCTPYAGGAPIEPETTGGDGSCACPCGAPSDPCDTGDECCSGSCGALNACD